jgi:oligopeptide transport system substrate-binding protein
MYKLLLPILLLLGVIGVAALSDRPQPRADFTFINSGNVSTLDPAIISWMQDIRVARMIGEGLVTKDIFSWNYDTKPAAAERWKVSEDRKTYTFHLRPDGNFSNGDPLRAGDFIYAWRRVMTPDVAADYVKFFDKVRGMNAYYDWRNAALRDYTARAKSIPTADRPAAARELWEQTLAKFHELVGVKAPDDFTIVVTLDKPVPYFLDLVAFPTFFPVHAKSVRLYERLDPDTGRIKWDQGWTKPPNLITNGPMKLTSWRFMRDMRFEKNPHYWNKDAIAVDSISSPSVDDANARVLAFNSGGVDWVSDVLAPYRGDMVREKLEFYREHQAEYDSLKAQGLDPIEIDRRLPPDPRNRLSVLPAFGTYFYNFNCLPRLPDGRANPFADARVRRAFALAIDKQAIVDNVRRTGEPVADTLIPRNSIPGYTSPQGLTFNPDLARKTLAEAGYPTGKDFPIAVEILFNKDAGHDLIAQAIAKNWEQHLGVNVILQQKEIKVFREDLKGANFISSRAGWFGDYGDPTTFLYLSYASADDSGQIIYDGNNDRKYHNPAFSALLDRAADELDPAKRLDLLSQAERIIVEQDFPMVPIFHYAQLYQFDPHRLTGISSHPRQEQLLHWADLLDDTKGPNTPKALPPRTGSAERGSR